MEWSESKLARFDAASAREAYRARPIPLRILAAVAALLVGGAILVVVGFAPNDFIHAAAHDVRHAVGFPCH